MARMRNEGMDFSRLVPGEFGMDDSDGRNESQLLLTERTVPCLGWPYSKDVSKQIPYNR